MKDLRNNKERKVSNINNRKQFNKNYKNKIILIRRK